MLPKVLDTTSFVIKLQSPSFTDVCFLSKLGAARVLLQ